MFSNESIQLVQRIAGPGYKTKCLLYQMVIQNNKTTTIPCKTKLDMLTRKFVISTFVLLKFCIISLGFYYDIFYNPNPIERSNFYLVTASLFLANHVKWFQFYTQTKFLYLQVHSFYLLNRCYLLPTTCTWI